MQRQDPVQTPQPAGPPITLVATSPAQQTRRYHWSHALVAAGLLAGSGFGSAVLVKVLLLFYILMPNKYYIKCRTNLS